MQSTLNSATQSTHSISSSRVVTGPPQSTCVVPGAGPGGTATGGQLATKPIWLGVRSSPRPSPATDPIVPWQAFPGPPHALQILAIFFDSAFAILSAALRAGVPGAAVPSGQPAVCFSFMRLSQHFWRIFVFAARNFCACLPIVRWHLLRAVPGVLGISAAKESALA